jgi:hypothetical protein
VTEDSKLSGVLICNHRGTGRKLLSAPQSCPREPDTGQRGFSRVRGCILYPYDTLITAPDAAKHFKRKPHTIHSWVTRYKIPRLGRTRDGLTILDIRCLAAVERAIRYGEPVPCDWAEFVRGLAA